MVGESRDGHFRLIAEQARTTRLAMGMGDRNRIREENIRNTRIALTELTGYARAAGVGRIRLAATGALRSAENGSAVAQQIKRETGIPCEILTEEAEGAMSFAAVRDRISPDGPLTVADVGGATMEIISGVSDEPDEFRSLPLGCIPVTEEWFTSDPPGESAWRNARRAIREALPAIPAGACIIAGCGGAFTSTAALLRGLKRDQVPLRGFRLNEKNVTDIGLFSSTLTIDERYALPGIGKARALLVPAGTAILAALLSDRDRQCLVSDRGFAWGLLLDTRKHFSPDM